MFSFTESAIRAVPLLLHSEQMENLNRKCPQHRSLRICLITGLSLLRRITRQLRLLYSPTLAPQARQEVSRAGKAGFLLREESRGD